MTTARTRRLAIAAAAMLALASCGDDPAPTPPPASTPPSPTPPATTPAAPTTSPTPDTAAAEDGPADAALAFGKSAPIADLATATAYGFRQPVAASAPRPNGQPGLTWAAADVKVCAVKNLDDEYDGITVTNDRWKLVYADDTEMGASNITYNQFPQPEYPTGEKDLPDGKCVRGWITFRALKDKRPAYVAYEPENQPGARWAVK
ncbi:hypothetical protein [Micromonospora chersina]|uniref:DUF4352 domain-containing protein n=1 Tax=Micromonospora chersina TaxID=47854 RepID=A0A1C6UPW5_9ACTN|nr:hypothetical protein [Micromonospora chersina]SCL56087.1 hypothetical protein GA0070603_2135 [Micromonospora chersina]